jgi:hypothetical protein
MLGFTLDWTVRGSNPVWGGKIFRTPTGWFWGKPSLLYNGYRIIPGVKSARKMAFTTLHHLAPRFKKEKSYISIPLWAFVSCSMVDFYLLCWRA